MAGRPNRMSLELTRQAECVMDIDLALSDGYQPHDECVLRAALYGLRVSLSELEDIHLDVIAARRTLTVGRAQAFDGRMIARERDVERTRLQYAQVGKEKATLVLRTRGVAGKGNRRR